MNVFNRIAMILLAVVAIIAVTAVCLFPDPFIERLSDLSQWLNDVQPRLEMVDRLILIAVFVVVDFVLLLLIALELRRPRAKAARVHQVEGGSALVTADSIKRRLAFTIDALPDVVSAKPQVEIRRDTVTVSAEVQTSAAVNVPSKAREIVSVIRMVISETMGLKLKGEPQVSIKIGSYKDLPPMPAQSESESEAEPDALETPSRLAEAVLEPVTDVAASPEEPVVIEEPASPPAGLDSTQDEGS